MLNLAELLQPEVVVEGGNNIGADGVVQVNEFHWGIFDHIQGLDVPAPALWL